MGTGCENWRKSERLGERTLTKSAVKRTIKWRGWGMDEEGIMSANESSGKRHRSSSLTGLSLAGSEIPIAPSHSS